MHIRKTKDFNAGLLFMFFGIGAMVFSRSYDLGTAAMMGPGYFPFALGGVLTLLGLGVLLGSLAGGKKGERKAGSFRWRPMVLVLSSVVLFGLLLRPMGLIFSTLFLVVVASLGSSEFRITEAVVSAIVLLGIVLVTFVYFLEFQIPVLPVFFR